MAKPIHVGDRLFASKREATEHIRTILYGYPRGRTVSPEHAVFLADLLELHPRRDAKVGVGIRSFQVEWNIGSPGFWLTRTDGTRTDFSYIQCITPPSKNVEVKAAFRTEIQGQISDFRSRAFAASSMLTCPITGEPLTPDHCHIDHILPFDDLLSSFMDARGLTVTSIELSPPADGEMMNRLKDRKLAQEWCDFHAERAGLRVVSITANLSILRRRTLIPERESAP